MLTHGVEIGLIARTLTHGVEIGLIARPRVCTLKVGCELMAQLVPKR
jgi:hypothetical protein